jgi:hypothetical protein
MGGAAWDALAALIAAGVAIGSCAGVLWHGGRRQGQVDEILRRLTKLGEDHEERIRDLEHVSWAIAAKVKR